MSTTPGVSARREPVCGHCGYNLRGLTETRCPECGQPFVWEEVLAAAADPRTVSFERSQDGSLAIRFLRTALTVLFMPWVFARQAAAHVQSAYGFPFMGICIFIAASVNYVGMYIESLLARDAIPMAAGLLCAPTLAAAWWLVASIFVIGQSAFLTLLDPVAWRRSGKEAFWFWVAVGGYTSAVILTEGLGGPPLVRGPEARAWLHDVLAGGLDWPPVRPAFRWECPPLGCLQHILWLVALGCCYWARVRQERLSGVVCVLLLAIAMTGVLVGYECFLAQWDDFRRSFAWS